MNLRSPKFILIFSTSKLILLQNETLHIESLIIFSSVISEIFYINFFRRFQRTDWRTERKLNSETFGVASTRRGGFRGRGYFTRGMGNMYRGSGGGGNPGFRGGYRGSRGGNRKPPNQQSNTVSQNRATNEQSASQSQTNVI